MWAEVWAGLRKQRAVEPLKVGTVTTSVWKSLGEEGKFQGPSESWDHERA